MFCKLALIFALALSLASFCNGQLVARTVWKMPQGRSHISAFYDGDDAIYLFGGMNPTGSATSQIMKFRLFSETVEIMRNMPSVGYGGSVQQDSQGKLFFFGGFSSGSNTYQSVFKYDVIANTCVEVATLPYDLRFSSSVKYNETSNLVYILGGEGDSNDVLVFDMENLQVDSRHTNSLPHNFETITSVQVDHYAYIFGNSRGTPRQNDREAVYRVDMNNFQSLTGPHDLPLFEHSPAAIFGGDRAWVIGGYKNGGAAATNGLLQFNVGNYHWDLIPVSEFPVDEDSYLSDAPSAVFVEKLDRIYFFGGASVTEGEEKLRDETWYVNLMTGQITTRPPTTTTTTTTTA